MIFAEKIADYFLKKDMISEKLAPWLSYAISHFCLSFFSYSALLLIGYFIVGIIPTAFFLVFFAFFRKYSGGWHASSPFKCFLFSCLCEVFYLTVCFSFFEKSIYISALILSLFSLLIVFFLAPQAPKEIHATERELVALKKRSRLTIVAQLICIGLLFALNFSSIALFSLLGTCCAAFSLVIQKLKIIRSV